MKKFLMTIAAAFVAVSMNAQNEMYVGGTLSFDSKYNYDSQFKIAPEFGVKLNDEWGVGAILSYTNTKYTTGTKANVFRFEPYARYYALNIGKVNVFVDGGVYFETTTNEPAGVGAKTTDNAFGLTVTPGIAFNLTEKISLVAHAPSLFNFDITSPDGGDTGMKAKFLNTMHVDDFGFGFYYNF